MKYSAAFALLILLGAGCFGSSGGGEVNQGAEPVPVSDQETAVVEDDSIATVDVIVDVEGEFLPSSAYDLYIAIPDKYLDLTLEERIDAISIDDEENFFIEFRPLTWDGAGTLAVFLVGDGREIIVFETRGCGPMCQQELYVFEIERSGWVDKTAELWPGTKATTAQKLSLQTVYSYDNPGTKIDDLPYAELVEIPQFGTELRAYDQWTGYVYGTIKWTGQKFEMTRKTDVVENITD